jgi:RNA-directed DNA polymerase
MTQNLETDKNNICTINSSEMWLELPWKSLSKETSRLQRRIYKASRNKGIAKTLELQKLLLHSYSARMIAIRQVTQLNEGKKTAGIDGKLVLTNAERFKLEKILHKQTKRWQHKGLREVPIPKPDGKVRVLKIPTIADRAWQCLIKLALEPAHEAWFHERSYGFRPGRSTHDAQKILFLQLKSTSNGKDKKVIELDIEKCFDRINHQTMLDKAIAPQWVKDRLRQCLQAGVSPDYPDQGTPQGGVISPLLANIALNGIEDIHTSVRYADDMVFILKPEDDAEQIQKQIENFLYERGMNISQKKTKVTTTQTGFDFLGWHFRVLLNGKFLSMPSKDSYRDIKNKIKAVVNNSTYGADEKSKLLGPIVRGWKNYHKHCNMSKHTLWHTNHKTWKKFINQPSINRYKANNLIKVAFPSISYSANRFINVKGNKSPFDGDLVYWSKRNSKYYNGPTVKTLKRNNYRCHLCNHYLHDEEKIELHHVDGNHNNWKPKNLQVLHQTCHDIMHHSRKNKIMKCK